MINLFLCVDQFPGSGQRVVWGFFVSFFKLICLLIMNCSIITTNNSTPLLLGICKCVEETGLYHYTINNRISVLFLSGDLLISHKDQDWGLLILYFVSVHPETLLCNAAAPNHTSDCPVRGIGFAKPCTQCLALQ